MVDDWKKDRIGSCVRGENPTLIVRMKSGYAVMADNQFLPGYCILLRYPRVAALSDLSLDEQAQYLVDTTLIGDAIQGAFNPRKINYSTLMNRDDFLHTHIEARYDWEDEEYKYKPSWCYPAKIEYSAEYDFSEELHGELKKRIAAELTVLMRQEGY